jgi:hypothetical protein
MVRSPGNTTGNDHRTFAQLVETPYYLVLEKRINVNVFDVDWYT